MSTVLTYISLASPLFALIPGWRQRFSLLWLYAATGLIIDNTGVILKLYEIKPYLLGNIFVAAELVFISAYYRDKIFGTKTLFWTLTPTLITAFTVHTLANGFNELNTLGIGILCMFYMGYGLAGFLKMLKSPQTIYLNQSPFFWINTAFFLYAASNCLLFIFIIYLKTESPQFLTKIWANFFTVVNILHYIFIGIGLYKTDKGAA